MSELNYENYKAKKAKGLWLVVKTDKGVAIQRKQFNIDTGEPIDPTYEYIDLVEGQAIQDKLTKKLVDIKLLMADASIL